MTRALPVLERKKIIKACENGLGTVEDVAKMFDVTARSVFRYLKKHRETGDLSPEPTPGRTPILNEKNLGIIKTIILLTPDGTLEQYRCEFYKRTKIDVTIGTIHNACKILNLKRKKKVSLLRSKTEKMLK